MITLMVTTIYCGGDAGSGSSGFIVVGQKQAERKQQEQAARAQKTEKLTQPQRQEKEKGDFWNGCKDDALALAQETKLKTTLVAVALLKLLKK